MKCPRCKNEFDVKLGAKLISKGCKILTAMTAIVTIQCEMCGAVFQVPIASKSFLVVKKEQKERKK
ncbi:hypothetical protein HYW74_01850 [Candidatus Pacearchaeota archaeon]|nr:hypothetical protein [Candidatus Pacearchaeota archaeon]